MNDQPWPITDEPIHAAFLAMLSDGSWGRYHGPHCSRLEDALRTYHATTHVQLCCSGTSAVELALRGIGVQAGDEVILAAYDFKSNFINVLALGAVPVLVDTVRGRPVLDPDTLSAAFSDRTRAVICSHLHGCLAEIGRIKAIAATRNVAVIEDACQAHGAMIRGHRAGSLGDVGVLSFGGSKLMTAGRGGAVLTNDDSIAQRIRLYVHRGNNAYPLSEMQSAVLLPQLHQLDHRNQLRLRNVRELLEQLPHDAMVTCPAWVEASSQDLTQSAFYKLGLLSVSVQSRQATEVMAAEFRHRGLAVDVGFPALHRIHSRSRFRAVGDLTAATELHDRLMVLHHPVLLRETAEIQQVASMLSNGFSDSAPA